MDKQNLIIFKFKSLYEIIKELEDNLNFNVFEASDEKMLNDNLINLQNYLIISQKKIENRNDAFFLNQVPVKLSKLVEKLNIRFLKLQFNEKAELNIGEYILDLNSRELRKKSDVVLKLTEKETNIIRYLSKSKNAVGIDQLQSEVWSHHSKLETHTVETHIYRLRKKILETFNDNNFIISQKNGYQIT